jgi:hypothetical protein
MKLKEAQIRAAGADLSVVVSQAVHPDTGEITGVDVTANFFGMPPCALYSKCYKTLPSNYAPELRYHNLNKDYILGVQPIAWGIIPFHQDHIYPRYVAVFSDPGSVNITLSVCEDMDGSPIVQSCRVDPSDPTDKEIKRYDIADSDQAITEMQQKFQNILEQLKSPSALSFEMEWDLDIEIPEIIADLTQRTATEPIWNRAVIDRGGHNFD